ncbi:copper-containing nitrite reductase [Haloarcula salinisoli]|uniref:Copper-containing nitrite reductase n=1 Tax=Haloarcula salinisoli TaxID=2487746 RepID=A0A8J8C6E2_9EURY|nr:copper-containing nitrite reductase [Halomicroarcula salinisoli]MBX0302157.1 nitrite reductase, copper-containing [Halomicroarcula salinisoli]
MSTIPEPTRRRVLQALGAGSVLLAGCSSAGPVDQTEQRTTSTPQSPSANGTQSTDVERVAADPTDIPDPIDRSTSKTIDVEMTTREQVAEIEPGVTYEYMTFDGQIPGPMVRVRRGDTVELTVTNDERNTMPHNIDLHAVRGPGGGAEDTMVAPGETDTIRFQATYPGAFIYHCAVPNMDYHISSGMFGMILVEPEDGLPEVDHEFYFGQQELYTTGETGEEGHHDFDMDAMTTEEPTYVLINGEKYAITPDRYGVPSMAVGDTARVFFVAGGPNQTSSFHPIGSVWDEVWQQGAIASQPNRFVQTTPVQPGSCAIATLHAEVPGPIKLVDHALSRVARKGAMAVISREGEANTDVFDPDPA